MINNLRLLRDDILLLLPPITGQLTRTQASGLDVHTLNSQTYDPVYGTIIAKSEGCKHVQLGDECFFQIFTFSTGVDRAYGDNRNEKFKDEYLPVTHMAFEEDGKWYMIISEGELYFLLRNVEYPEHHAAALEMLNGYVLATPVEKEEIKFTPISEKAYDGSNNKFPFLDEVMMLDVDLSNKSYKPNQATIHCSADPYLPAGAKVHTLRYCDITIEEQYNNPILSALVSPLGDGRGFIIESKNIIAILMNNTYRAGLKRLILKPDEVENETSSGLINLERGKEKLLTGTVISVGQDCAAWNIGEKVLYARNSGMPIEDAEGNLLVLEDKDVFAGVSIAEPVLPFLESEGAGSRELPNGGTM